jgi:hypothetical protein
MVPFLAVRAGGGGAAVSRFFNFGIFFAFYTKAKKCKKAELKTLNRPFKSGVNLDLSTPMEPLGWVYAGGRRTDARGRQGMQEGGAPPGPPKITPGFGDFLGGPPKSPQDFRYIRGGPGAHLARA